MKLLVRTGLVTLLGLAVQASAAPRVCIGGDLDHLTAAEKNGCRASADQVRRDAEKFHAPDDWHFYVMCTESDWTTYASIVQRGGELSAQNVDTDITKHTTFFRGAALTLGDPSRFHLLIAHESARGVLNSLDETAVQKQVSLWIPQENQGVLLAEAR